jgi:hypothetical protein
VARKLTDHLVGRKVVKLLREQGAFVSVGADYNWNAVESAGLKTVITNTTAIMRMQHTLANTMGLSDRFTPSTTGLKGRPDARQGCVKRQAGAGAGASTGGVDMVARLDCCGVGVAQARGYIGSGCTAEESVSDVTAAT